MGGIGNPQSWGQDLAGFALSSAVGAVTGGISSVLAGGSFEEGAKNGAIGYAISVDLPSALENSASENPRFHLLVGLGVDLLTRGLVALTPEDTQWGAAAHDFVEGWDQGGYAVIDGALPFGKPFGNHGYYDVNSPMMKFSGGCGMVASSCIPTGAAGRLLAKFGMNSRVLGKGSWLFGRVFKGIGQEGVLNRGPIRVGWGWIKEKQLDTFRIAIGSKIKTGSEWLNKTWENVRHMDF